MATAKMTSQRHDEGEEDCTNKMIDMRAIPEIKRFQMVNWRMDSAGCFFFWRSAMRKKMAMVHTIKPPKIKATSAYVSDLEVEQGDIIYFYFIYIFNLLIFDSLWSGP